MTIGGLSELLELLLLQTLSEFNLRISQLLASPQVHPETLFDTLLSLLGRLSIIPGGERLWDRADLVYLHDEPHNCYFQLFASIRRALSLVIEAPAVALPFVDRGDSIYLCPNDSQLRLENWCSPSAAVCPSSICARISPHRSNWGRSRKSFS